LGKDMALTVAITDLTDDRQRLPVIVKCSSELAEAGVCFAQIGQAVAFRIAVADFAGDVQRLLA
jgi:hypothetical protein